MHLKRDDERVILSLNISAMCLFYSEGVKLLRKKFVPFGRLFQTLSLKLNENSFPRICLQRNTIFFYF